MAAPTCSRCGGRRWVRYFSETTDGNFEEAFRLCPCNHKPEEGRGEDRREKPERAGNIAREKPARRRIGVIELRVELW
jgi:hypothetical protein